MKLLLALLISFNALAVIPYRTRADKIELGKSGSTASKEIVFDFDLGSSNPNLYVDETNKNLNYNGGLILSGDDLEINGLGFQVQSGELLVKKKTGDSFKKIGSGSGGGGGENFNNAFGEDDNANAEDGANSWNKVGVNGIISLETADPLEGEQSLKFDAQDQNDYVQNCVDVNKQKFWGKACEARLEYIGGDENLSFGVFDNAGNEYQSTNETLETANIFSQKSVYFDCPSESQITGDANLATMCFRITQSTSTDADPITFDKAYLGTLRGLTEVSQADDYHLYLNATCGIISKYPDDWSPTISNLTVNSAPTCKVENNLGLSNIPVYSASVAFSGGTDMASMAGVLADQVTLYCGNSSGSNNDCNGFMFSLKKVGSDAKQSIQVYKSIPKKFDFINSFSSRVGTTGAVASENVDWLDGDCVVSGSARRCSFKSGVFSQAPSCWADAKNTQSQHTFCKASAETDSYVDITCKNTSGSSFTTASGFSVVCEKQSDDYKTPTVQLFPVNNNRILIARTTTASNPILVSDNDENFVQSIATSGGLGSFTGAFTPGVFDVAPMCWCNIHVAASTGVNDCQVHSETTTSFIVNTTASTTGVHNQFTLFCKTRN